MNPLLYYFYFHWKILFEFDFINVTCVKHSASKNYRCAYEAFACAEQPAEKNISFRPLIVESNIVMLLLNCSRNQAAKHCKGLFELALLMVVKTSTFFILVAGMFCVLFCSFSSMWVTPCIRAICWSVRLNMDCQVDLWALLLFQLVNLEKLYCWLGKFCADYSKVIVCSWMNNFVCLVTVKLRCCVFFPTLYRKWSWCCCHQVIDSAGRTTCELFPCSKDPLFLLNPDALKQTDIAGHC